MEGMDRRTWSQDVVALIEEEEDGVEARRIWCGENVQTAGGRRSVRIARDWAAANDDCARWLQWVDPYNACVVRTLRVPYRMEVRLAPSEQEVARFGHWFSRFGVTPITVDRGKVVWLDE